MSTSVTDPAEAAAVASESELLRRLPFLADLGDSDLARLQRLAKRIRVAAGELIMSEGTTGDGLYVVVEGEVEVVRRDGGREVMLAVHGPGAFLGEMSLLEQAPRSASVRALRDTQVLVIGPAEFEALLAGSPAASLTMLGAVTSRLRATEAALIQRETLASLGTLAAGLAHELNNPASALRRGVHHLRDAMEDWGRGTAALARLGLDETEVASLRVLEGIIRDAAPVGWDPVGAGKEERRIEDWLRDRGIATASEIAAALAAAGWRLDRIEALARDFRAGNFSTVLEWIAAATTGYGVLDELAHSARAVSEIVDAARSYVYLDRAAVQSVDLRESLANALIILKSKLGDKVSVAWDLAPDLPPIEAYGGELSQVWTNLIDNAIDAMEGAGTLKLRGRRAGEAVVIEIADSGPGIPPELRPRVFDPFFTTKPPGLGSGLGLHIAYGIVVNRHRGSIRLNSGRRGTTAEVVLPIRGGEATTFSS